ncbi:uncharacterized protein V6R79_018782 [Siganus canaliculatus]
MFSLAPALLLTTEGTMLDASDYFDGFRRIQRHKRSRPDLPVLVFLWPDLDSSANISVFGSTGTRKQDFVLCQWEMSHVEPEGVRLASEPFSESSVYHFKQRKSSCPDFSSEVDFFSGRALGVFRLCSEALGCCRAPPVCQEGRASRAEPSSSLRCGAFAIHQRGARAHLVRARRAVRRLESRAAPG